MLNEACGIASLLKCYLNQSGKSRRRLRWVLPHTETQRHRGRYRAGTQKEMCQCENVANAQVQYPIRATTLIIGNTFTLAHFHIPRSPFPVPHSPFPVPRSLSFPCPLARRRCDASQARAGARHGLARGYGGAAPMAASGGQPRQRASVFRAERNSLTTLCLCGSV